MIAIGKDTIVFAKIETTLGTWSNPAATDVVLLTGEGSAKQEREFLEDDQRRRTLSKLPRVAGAFLPGEWNFPYYIKPSGALGTPPRGNQFLTAGFGIETIVGATSVAYTLGGIDADIVSLSVSFRQGRICYFLFGVIVDQLVFPIDPKALGMVTMSGQFLKLAKAGTDAVNDAAGYAAAVTEVVVDDADCFDVGALIEFQKADLTWTNNTGAGHTIATVVKATNTITFAPGLDDAIVDDAVVRGFVPTPTDAGTIVHGQYGICQEDIDAAGYADLVISKGELTLKNNFQIIPDMKVNGDYPTAVVKANNREISLNIEQIISEGYAKYHTYAKGSQVIGLKLPVGAIAATRYRLEAPYCRFNIPDISGDAEQRGNRVGVAYGSSAYDDELSLMFD